MRGELATRTAICLWCDRLTDRHNAPVGPVMPLPAWHPICRAVICGECAVEVKAGTYRLGKAGGIG